MASVDPKIPSESLTQSKPKMMLAVSYFFFFASKCCLHGMCYHCLLLSKSSCVGGVVPKAVVWEYGGSLKKWGLVGGPLSFKVLSLGGHEGRSHVSPQQLSTA